MGRPAKPSHLRVVGGKSAAPGQARPAGRQHGTLYAAIPDKPDVVANNEIASAEWDRLIPELHDAGLMTHAYMAHAAAYCVAYARWVKMETEIAGTGEIVASPNNFPVHNPFLSVANKALEQMRSIASDLGFTPTSLAKAERAPQGDLFESLDDLLEDDDDEDQNEAV